jgi:diguanylate cyclase (GGDEF)-like protein
VRQLNSANVKASTMILRDFLGRTTVIRERSLLFKSNESGCSIRTHRDVLKHTARRVAIAVGLAGLLTAILIVINFGSDLDAQVRLGELATHGIAMSILISGILSGVLTYRSGLLMWDLNKSRAELLRLSCTDQLTGLLNRRGYLAAAQRRLLSRAFDKENPAIALMCDIDRFKAINDHFGHDFGDHVLKIIGDKIRLFAEQHDILVGRHGGEEFAALITDTQLEEAIRRANALRQICAGTKIDLADGTSTSVTLSIGLAAVSDPPELSKIMRAADEALYTAKRTGRNRVVQANSMAA